MDLDYTEEQEILRKSAHDFLDTECPMSMVREMENDAKGYSPELWRKMAELGWLGIAFPEQYGGSDYSFLELTLLLEEMGRVLLPCPFIPTVVLSGLPILFAGTEEQKQTLLPKIANGEIITTLALTEASGGWDASNIEVSAMPRDNGFTISGTKIFIHFANIADYFLLVTRTNDGATPEEGITLFLVNAKSPGISYSLLDTIARDKQCEVVFSNVEVPKDSILGELDKGWPLVQQIVELGAVAECATMLGGAQQVLEMATEYAKERIVYGHPIGSYQQIQSHCTDMLADVNGSRYLIYRAAWRISESLPCTMEIAMAKAWVSDAYQRVCILGHQIFGGIGFTADHDMGLYFRRAKVQELSFGDGDFHRQVVARELDI